MLKKISKLMAYSNQVKEEISGITIKYESLIENIMKELTDLKVQIVMI